MCIRISTCMYLISTSSPTHTHLYTNTYFFSNRNPNENVAKYLQIYNNMFFFPSLRRYPESQKSKVKSPTPYPCPIRAFVRNVRADVLYLILSYRTYEWVCMYVCK